jgi:hypothetical protein
MDLVMVHSPQQRSYLGLKLALVATLANCAVGGRRIKPATIRAPPAVFFGG